MTSIRATVASLLLALVGTVGLLAGAGHEAATSPTGAATSTGTITTTTLTAPPAPPAGR